METSNANRALPGGPIGVAVNGVIFFNPFDADSVEAIWRLDRCCGHPSPGFEYHYHKYPVCVKSPWTDDGTADSPLIGFAFDGFPIYGPYESAGELAKDSQKNPLNAFNIHRDDARLALSRHPRKVSAFDWRLLGLRRRPQSPPPAPPAQRPPRTRTWPREFWIPRRLWGPRAATALSLIVSSARIFARRASRTAEFLARGLHGYFFSGANVFCTGEYAS